jgi:branched-chain amino acid transport system ATP-binding protein
MTQPGVPLSSTPLLSTHGLTAFYGDFQALFGIDLEVHAGEVAAIIGANGAGKSTFLKVITGLVGAPPQCVRFQGQHIGGLPAYAILALGIALVPEGRRLFTTMTVPENLESDYEWKHRTRRRLMP